jgi:hypothetical protein
MLKLQLYQRGHSIGVVLLLYVDDVKSQNCGVKCHIIGAYQGKA